MLFRSDLAGWRGVGQLGPIPLAAPGLDRLPPLLHWLIDAKNLVEIGGLDALRFLPGCHDPAEPAAIVADARAGQSSASPEPSTAPVRFEATISTWACASPTRCAT